VVPRLFFNLWYDFARHNTSPFGGLIMGELLQPWHLLVFAFLIAPVTVVMLPPFWVIFKKAGFEPILSVLMLVPVVNLVVLYVVAFSQWKPALRQNP
jgi:hypothetical protein